MTRENDEKPAITNAASNLRTNRRRFLQAAGVGAAGLTALGGYTAAQSDDDNHFELEAVSVDVTGGSGRSEYAWEDGTGGVVRGPPEEVCGVVGGQHIWMGIAPGSIADVVNPTLELTAGETYTVEWTNTDGEPHNFVIVDDEGNELVSTDDLSTEGESQTVEFEATAEMAEYYCGTHPSSQRGDVQVGDEPDPGPDQVDVLVFSVTGEDGFRHANIEYGNQQLQALDGRIAEETGADDVTIDVIDGVGHTDEFPSDVSGLEPYDVVVWNNTNGDVLNEDQQDAFEQYIQSGGGYAGIHSATATEYDWEFYGDLVGAYFDNHPAPTDAEIHVTDRVHPSTDHLPASWESFDEWYGFQSNPRGDVHVLATLDESSYVTEDTQSYMNYEGHESDHPIAWCHEFQGGRSWYTGRGHTEEAFDEENFIEHVLGGILWAGGFVEGDATGTVWDAYEKEDVVTGLTDPTTMAVADDGRLFFTHGHTNRESPPGDAKVSAYDPVTGSVSEVMSFEIYTGGNTGLFGLELDPDFEDNGWVYLQYAPVDDEVNRVSRFTYEDGSIDLDSEEQLLDVDVQRETSHHAGGVLQFGPEGDLYIATGDDTEFNESSNYTPIDEGDDRQHYDAQRSSANTADLRGSILRITPTDDGGYTVPEGNLKDAWEAETGETFSDEEFRPEIFVMGLRNPFKMDVDEETGALWYSDYGPDAMNWDPERGPPGIVEFTRATEPHFAGWPYFTGPNIPYVDYDFETEESGEPFDPENPINDSPNNTGLTELPPATEPTIYYSYNWDSLLEDPPEYAQEYLPEEPPYPEIAGGGAPHAGPVFRTDDDHGSDALPEYYDGKHFMLEYGQDWVKYATFDEDGELLEIEPFLPAADFSDNFEMEVAADGSLYHLDWGGGTISRITGSGVDTIVTASLSVDGDSLEPGASTTGTVTVTNVSDSEVTDLSVSVTAEGDAITVTPPSQTSFDTVAAGASETLEYVIDVGDDAPQGSYEVTADVTFTQDGEALATTASTSITVSDPGTGDQFFWQASDHETGDQPDGWEPMANVGDWGIDEDDDGQYLGLQGPASTRTSLRYTEPGNAEEMEVWALAKATDPDGDYWVYSRGSGEDAPGTELTAPRANDYIAEDAFRLGAYDGGDLTLGESVDHVGVDQLYQVRLQVSGDTMRARWWPADAEEPDEWDLEADGPAEASGYAGLGHWTGEPYQLYAMGVGVGGAEAPTGTSEDRFTEVDTTAEGNATFDQENLVIEAAGADVWENDDEYGALVEEDVEGDVVAETTVVSQDDTGDFAKAGIMAANDASAPGSSAGDVAMYASPGGDAFSLAWDDDGDGYVETSIWDGTPTYPVDLRLTKAGTTYTGEYSTDGGSTWTTIGSTTVEEANETQDWGLFVCSWTAGTLNRSEFDRYALEEHTPPAEDGFEARGTEPVDVVGEDGPVAQYMHAFDEDDFYSTYKTFLNVLDPSNGERLTADPSQGTQYPHHRGLFIGWDRVTVDGDVHDFWHMDNDERMVHTSFDGSLETFADTHTLRSINHWTTSAGGETVIEETRELSFSEAPTDDGVVVVDMVSTLEATADSDVELLGDPEHAGIQYRPHDDVNQNGSAEYIFPSDAFDSADPSNDEINSEEGLRWAAQTHDIRDEQFFVQHVNHPDNPSDSVYSAYRDYGRFGAFFEETLSPGETLTVGYRILVKRGAAPSQSDLESYYDAFAATDVQGD